MSNRFVRYFVVIFIFVGQSAYGEVDGSLWRVTFNTQWLGPVDVHFELRQEGKELYGVSQSGAISILEELPGDHDLSDGLVAFKTELQSDGSFSGSFTAPWNEGELSVVFDGDNMSGAVQGGAFNGDASGQRVKDASRLRDYVAVLESFDKVVAAKIFAPEKLQEASYVAFRTRLGEIAELAQDDLDLLFGFHWLWANDPFSHFQLKRSEQSAEALFTFFDSYRVGFEAASVTFEGDIAILKVATMMGADTIEQVEKAYDEIREAGSQTLIIDLRGNGGGAFAVKPLVAHVISEPVDSGYFLSQLWNANNEALPTKEQVMAIPPWEGWSIVEFWRNVQNRELLRIQFRPAEPHFAGKVFVLLDKQSASATELAADALRASGVAVLIGQTTAGEMLSQSFFDVAENFSVSLPVADYYSLAHGRIEGNGVPVDIEADDAMAVAKQLAK